MNLGPYSMSRLRAKATLYNVCSDFRDPLINYLVHGWLPGSFMSSVLADAGWAAIQHCHPATNIQEMKNMVVWIINEFPREARGSLEKVRDWSELSHTERRAILHREGLIYTEEEELMLILKHGPDPVVIV